MQEAGYHDGLSRFFRSGSRLALFRGTDTLSPGFRKQRGKTAAVRTSCRVAEPAKGRVSASLLRQARTGGGTPHACCLVLRDRAICELEAMPPFAPIDSISLTHFLHCRGINMRLVGESRRLGGTQFSCTGAVFKELPGLPFQDQQVTS